MDKVLGFLLFLSEQALLQSIRNISTGSSPSRFDDPSPAQEVPYPMKTSPLLEPPKAAFGLTPGQAHILCLVFASSYVGSIYITQHFFLPRANRAPPQPAPLTNGQNGSTSPPIPARDMVEDKQPGPKPGNRDHPTTIRMRMKAVGLATVSNVLVVLGVVKMATGSSWSEAMPPTHRLLGLALHSPGFSSQALLPYLLTPMLFLGPLYAEYLDGSLPLQRTPALSSSTSPLSGLSLISWRNYVVGPLTEELTFRSSIISVCLLTRLSPPFLVFETPLWFGVAHLHHALEVYRSGGSTKSAAIQALLGCLFQLGYTTLFGWFASYLFIRTGSILPPLTSHVFCNMMGIYLPSSAVGRHPRNKTSIWVAYGMGIASFAWALRAL